MQGWTKWCETNAEADEAEEDGWFLAALFEEFIKLVLKHFGRPFVELGKPIGGELENITKFFFRKLFERSVKKEFNI